MSARGEQGGEGSAGGCRDETAGQDKDLAAVEAGSVSGVLTRAGTFLIRDEETTGYVVSCSREALEALPRLPMYQRVQIVDAEALSYRRFEHVLVKHGLVDACAIEDPEGFDNYHTHGAIHAAHRELLLENAELRNAPERT